MYHRDVSNSVPILHWLIITNCDILSKTNFRILAYLFFHVNFTIMLSDLKRKLFRWELHLIDKLIWAALTSPTGSSPSQVSVCFSTSLSYLTYLKSQRNLKLSDILYISSPMVFTFLIVILLLTFKKSKKKTERNQQDKHNHIVTRPNTSTIHFIIFSTAPPSWYGNCYPHLAQVAKPEIQPRGFYHIQY